MLDCMFPKIGYKKMTPSTRSLHSNQNGYHIEMVEDTYVNENACHENSNIVWNQVGNPDTYLISIILPAILLPFIITYLYMYTQSQSAQKYINIKYLCEYLRNPELTDSFK